MDLETLEMTGPNYSVEKMMTARCKTTEAAVKAIADFGWVLNLGLTDHRLSDYPHKAHFAGTLGTIDVHPSPNLWILEIQIRHPRKPFGGFFEDLLLSSQED